MSTLTITDSLLTDIADAIRAKNGSTDEYTPAQMATAIANIPGGITPTGTINITQNGTVDVTQYAYAAVSVSGGSVLPAGYTEVEYVRNGVSGYPYIETGVTPGVNVEIDITFMYMVTKSDNNAVICGSRGGTNSAKRFFAASMNNSTTNLRFVFGTGVKTADQAYNSKHHAVFNNSSHKAIIDDYEISGSYSVSDFSGNSNTVWLYGAHDSDGLSFACQARIYGFKAVDTSSGTVLCNLIPCYRTSDSVVGFYDTVNDVFRVNLGDGTLEKGPDAA